jgi:hypothetical protein
MVNGVEDAGPWGDVRKFNLRPPPAQPEPPSEAGNNLNFSWSGEAGQTYLFEVARDTAFTQKLESRILNAPTVAIARPPQGTYYVRLRATDADGFVGPFTAPQRFVVINRLTDGGGASVGTSDGNPVRMQ